MSGAVVVVVAAAASQSVVVEGVDVVAVFFRTILATGGVCARCIADVCCCMCLRACLSFIIAQRVGIIGRDMAELMNSADHTFGVVAVSTTTGVTTHSSRECRLSPGRQLYIHVPVCSIKLNLEPAQ